MQSIFTLHIETRIIQITIEKKLMIANTPLWDLCTVQCIIVSHVCCFHSINQKALFHLILKA